MSTGTAHSHPHSYLGFFCLGALSQAVPIIWTKYANLS